VTLTTLKEEDIVPAALLSPHPETMRFEPEKVVCKLGGRQTTPAALESVTDPVSLIRATSLSNDWLEEYAG